MTVTIEAIETIKNHCEHYNAPKFSGSIIMLLFCFKFFGNSLIFLNNLRFFFALKMAANEKKCPIYKKKALFWKKKTATLIKTVKKGNGK